MKKKNSIEFVKSVKSNPQLDSYGILFKNEMDILNYIIKTSKSTLCIGLWNHTIWSTSPIFVDDRVKYFH